MFYDFDSIRINAQALAFNLASAYVNSPLDSELEAVSAMVVILDNLAAACLEKDIVQVRIYWSEFNALFFGFNPGAGLPQN